MSNQSTAKVVTPKGLIYELEVDWETRRRHCSCKQPHQTELPCGHVLAMLEHQKKHVPDYWSCYTWMTQHLTPVSVVRVDNLVADPEKFCCPLHTKMPRGRSKGPGPRKARFGISRRKCRNHGGNAVDDDHIVQLVERRGTICHLACRRPHNQVPGAELVIFAVL